MRPCACEAKSILNWFGERSFADIFLLTTGRYATASLGLGNYDIPLYARAYLLQIGAKIGKLLVLVDIFTVFTCAASNKYLN